MQNWLKHSINNGSEQLISKRHTKYTRTKTIFNAWHNWQNCNFIGPLLNIQFIIKILNLLNSILSLHCLGALASNIKAVYNNILLFLFCILRRISGFLVDRKTRRFFQFDFQLFQKIWSRDFICRFFLM